VCSSDLVEGGGTLIVDWLESTLRLYGHDVDVVKLPFSPSYTDMPAQMLALRLIDVTEHGDRLIAIRTPSYLLRHPRKTIWFIHHHRGAYDLWGTPYQDIPDTIEGRAYRQAIISADQSAFAEARSIYANSAVVARRLRDYNGIDAEVLYPPVFQPERFHCGEYGDYVLYVSRLNRHKRQDLAIQSMKYTRTPAKMVIMGKADTPDDERRLRAEIKRNGVQHKVTLNPGWAPEKEKIERYAGCLAAIYVPYEEDSYGFVSLEAHHSGKSVISTTDSGGTKELIVDGENGFLADPAPQAIAECIDRLYSDRLLAEKMGRAGLDRIRQLGVSWDRVVDRLLA